MMTDIEAFAGVRLGAGTLYGAITRAEERGLIEPATPAERGLKPLNVTVIAVSCVVALLAFAAGDDITTGSEPSHALEWIFLAFAAAWFLAAGVWAWRKRPPSRTSTG